MRKDRVAVTGIGIISALGWSPGETWSAIEAERSGLAPLSLFRSERYQHVLVAEVKGDPTRCSGLRTGSRNDHLATIAARCAFDDAAMAALPKNIRNETAVVLGTCTGGMLDTETFMLNLINENRQRYSLLRHHEPASVANAVAAALGLRGFRATPSTACTSGAAAVATACDVLASGEADIVLTGGVDSLTRLTLHGFCSLLNVAPDGCRPFDVNRAGLSLGEAAAILVLETEPAARARGVRIRAFIAGTGNTCDAYHVTAPSPDGSQAARAMELALHHAGVQPHDVNYVNAHGTGTLDNDVAEAKALTRVFRGSPPPTSSTKGFFGHTLAAAGAVEAIVCILALEHRRIPGNLGLQRADPAIGFEPVVHPRDAELEVVLSNSFGFGGNNCSIVLTRP